MADLPIGDIIRNITDDVKLLVQDQIDLLKTELTPAAKLGGTGAGLFGVAGYFALSAHDHFLLRCRLRPRRCRPRSMARILDRGRCTAPDRRQSAPESGCMLVRKIKGPERTIAQANRTVTEVQDAAQHALAAARAPQIEGQVVPAPKPLPERSG